jgi:hypothetical protein
VPFRNNKRFQVVEIKNTSAGRRAPYHRDADPRLRVTVMVTTEQGTLAALKTAVDLAPELGLQLVLVSITVVPCHLPIDVPPVSISFLEQRARRWVAASGVEAEQTHFQIYLCRDRKQCLQKVLAPNSLVVIGGKRRWWTAQEQKLEKYLRSLGHRTIFVEAKSPLGNGVESFLHSR